MILEPELETLPRDDLRALQARRLGELVAYLRERVLFYRDALSAAGVQSGEVTSLDDLRQLPFTRNDDLRDHYPFGLLAVPREELARVHASSGTTGKLNRRRLHELRPRAA